MKAKVLLYYLPFLIATIFQDSNNTCFIISWIGSIFILLMSLSPFMTASNEIFSKPLRGMVITNCIFSIYMSIGSIFYFLDINGYMFFTEKEFFSPNEYELNLVKEAQLIYVLAQASFATGLTLTYKNNIDSDFEIVSSNMSTLSMRFTIISFLLGVFLNSIPGMSQFGVLFAELSMVASSLGLTLAILEKKNIVILITASFFILNEVNALLSGWKEAVIVPIILLGSNLYPHYKKTVGFMFPFVLFVILYFIPTYNQVIRQNAWSGETTTEEAAQIALDELQQLETEKIEETNWDFLIFRFSEISLLAKYIDAVPQKIDFYGTKIIEQSFVNIIPRIFYPSKPITEKLVMERVVQTGVVDELSVVSAKPQVAADAYLTGGKTFVFIFFIIFGIIINWCSNKCEYLFGGYTYGVAIIFTGIFQIFWRGNCFEFLFNSIFWGIFIMYGLFFVGKKLNIIKYKNEI